MKHLGIACGLLICSGLYGAKAGAQAQLPASATAAEAAAATTPSAPVAAANPQTPEEFFARARQLSDLEASGIPFHLKATYVASGDAEFTGNGTYEEWWQSKNVWRKEATLGDYKYVAIKNGEKSSIYATSSYVPLRLRQVLDAVLIRIPSDADTSGDWKSQHKKLHGIDLTVLSKQYPCTTAKKDPSKQKCLCLDYFTVEGVFRVQVDASTTVYNGMRLFHNLLIPRNIAVADADQAPTLAVSVDTLELLSSDEKIGPKLDDIPAGLQPAENSVRVDQVHENPNATEARLIHKVPPTYPDTARQKRIEGTVMMNATIDDQGNLREPDVIYSTESLFDDAALKAVRQWKFVPVTINGKSVAFETTITVVFFLGY